jgi:hypothetical protein
LEKEWKATNSSHETRTSKSKASQPNSQTDEKVSLYEISLSFSCLGDYLGGRKTKTPIYYANTKASLNSKVNKNCTFYTKGLFP